LTLLIRVEGVLNARPLCYTKHVSQENEVLTPAHFLYGKSARSTLIDPIKLPLSTAFQNLQNRLNYFRKLWTRDYLNHLQYRNEWEKQSPSLAEGEIVVLKEESRNQFDWPLAKVVKIYPGPDGLVRVVDLLYRSKTYKRNVGEIVRLSLDPPDNGVSRGETVLR